MSLGYKNRIVAAVTAVSNTFIDEYMAAANGEYVKVYLYLLRHAGEPVTVSDIADALNHTEADVTRALTYFERVGVLDGESEKSQEDGKISGMPDLSKASKPSERSDRPDPIEEAPETSDKEKENAVLTADTGDSYERMQRLSSDEEFSALLYAVQQYLGKTFSPIECEKFAYFYDGLHMSCELLEYLAEYCAMGGHTSIRYIEKVALNWYEAGIHTRDEAKEQSSRYSKDTSRVLKAFGITGRSAGTAEQEYMRKWFKEFGFDSDLVTEACNRTITATGSASFPYADKILAGWKENGVRTLQDVTRLDKRRQEMQTKKQTTQPKNGRSQTSNRFHNFEQRSYNYEDYVWADMKRRKEGGGADGTQ